MVTYHSVLIEYYPVTSVGKTLLEPKNLDAISVRALPVRHTQRHPV